MGPNVWLLRQKYLATENFQKDLLFESFALLAWRGKAILTMISLVLDCCLLARVSQIPMRLEK